MTYDYRLQDPGSLRSPALLFYPELIRANLQKMIEIAGDPLRLRPHAKTHKCAEIARRELAMGIVKHKCATLAEAEMLARCNAPDVLIAYPIVGPHMDDFARLLQTYPETAFSLITDDYGAIYKLAVAMLEKKLNLDVLVDVNIGQNRTGIAPGLPLIALYEALTNLWQHVRPGGLHLYDGHNSSPDLSERQRLADQVHATLKEMTEDIQLRKWPLPRVVIGGTPAFAIHARMENPALELSPGTCVLHDANYQRDYPDLPFTPAALLLTRCVSRPAPNRVTFDLGTKALSADPSLDRRCIILGMEEAKLVAHNEEHLVVETGNADAWQPGVIALVIPGHVCPTVALHRKASIVEKGLVTTTWEITARDRELTLQ